MDMSSSKRGAWQAENDQDGGSQSGSTGSKVDPARGGKVGQPGGDGEPEPAAATDNADDDSRTGEQTKVEGGRTQNVTKPDRG